MCKLSVIAKLNFNNVLSLSVFYGFVLCQFSKLDIIYSFIDTYVYHISTSIKQFTNDGPIRRKSTFFFEWLHIIRRTRETICDYNNIYACKRYTTTTTRTIGWFKIRILLGFFVQLRPRHYCLESRKVLCQNFSRIELREML